MRTKDCILMSDQQKIMDKFGIKRDVEYVQIFKIENNLIKRNRMFFKDYDGTLIELNVPKRIVKTKDLRKIKKRVGEQLATLYGTHANDGNYLEELLKSTERAINGKAFDEAVGDLIKNESQSIGTANEKNSPAGSEQGEEDPILNFEEQRSQNFEDEEEEVGSLQQRSVRYTKQGYTGGFTPGSKTSNLL